MRTSYRPPRKKRFFHTKPKQDKRDHHLLKQQLNQVSQNKEKKRLEDEHRKLLRDHK